MSSFSGVTSLLAEASAEAPQAASGSFTYMWLLIALPLLGATILLIAGKRTDRWGHWLAILASGAAFVVACVVFTAMLAITFAMFGFIASNFNALAMEPVGRVAGSASAIYGAVTATGGAIAGALIARAFDGTPVPFAIGLAASGAATLLAVLWTERGRLFGASTPLVQKP